MESGKYRADIDGLRALAVMLVLVYHFDLLSFASAGFIGVDVFFVISGYLITSIIRRDLDRNKFSIGTFYVRRVRRLAPALTVTLVLTLVAGWYFLFPSDFLDLTVQAFFSQFYVANIYYWQSINYFGLVADKVYLLHTWSLAVEEQFYLIYPLVLLVTYRYLKPYFWWILSFGAIASFGLNVLFVDSKPEATFYLLPTRAWELLIGGLIPLVDSRLKRNALTDEVVSIIGIALIIASVVAYNERYSFPGYFAVIPVLGTAAYILAGSGGTPVISRFFSLAPIAWIGKISYPLYLVHWPINVFAVAQFGDDYDIFMRTAMFVLSIVISALIYYTIENPIRLRRVMPTNASVLNGYLASLCCIGLVMLVIYRSDGLPSRFPANVTTLAEHVNDRSPPLDECRFAEGSPTTYGQYCVIGDASQQPTWFVFGDSHAWAGYAAFDAWFRDMGVAAHFAYLNSCPPLIGTFEVTSRGNCFEFNRQIAGYIENSDSIENVLLVSTWLQAPEGRLSVTPTRTWNEAESIRTFTAQFKASIEMYNSEGTNVYVWEPLPGARANVPMEAAKAALEGRTAHLEWSTADYERTFDFFFSALDSNRSLVAGTFSPARALCDTQNCAVMIDDSPAYFDNSHMSHSTWRFWLEVLKQQHLSNHNAQSSRG